MFEDCEVFAKNYTDIGDIKEFQINLTDEIPVNKAYRHLPRKLYDDVDKYINDLFINGWIEESKSPYADPIVCVRKKDNSLCVSVVTIENLISKLLLIVTQSPEYKIY